MAVKDDDVLREEEKMRFALDDRVKAYRSERSPSELEDAEELEEATYRDSLHRLSEGGACSSCGEILYYTEFDSGAYIKVAPGYACHNIDCNLCVTSGKRASRR